VKRTSQEAWERRASVAAHKTVRVYTSQTAYIYVRVRVGSRERWRVVRPTAVAARRDYLYIQQYIYIYNNNYNTSTTFVCVCVCVCVLLYMRIAYRASAYPPPAAFPRTRPCNNYIPFLHVVIAMIIIIILYYDNNVVYIYVLYYVIVIVVVITYIHSTAAIYGIFRKI